MLISSLKEIAFIIDQKLGLNHTRFLIVYTTKSQIIKLKGSKPSPPKKTLSFRNYKNVLTRIQGCYFSNLPEIPNNHGILQIRLIENPGEEII